MNSGAVWRLSCSVGFSQVGPGAESRCVKFREGFVSLLLFYVLIAHFI